MLKAKRYGISQVLARGGSKGFTLVELLLVLVILGTLAAVVIPKFTGSTERANRTAAATQISTFSTALDAFEVDNGFYPQGNDGLGALVVEPRNARNWHGPYLKSDIPKDPWGNEYIYECPGRHNANGYDIVSVGFDGQRDTEDDITNWNLSEKK